MYATNLLSHYKHNLLVKTYKEKRFNSMDVVLNSLCFLKKQYTGLNLLNRSKIGLEIESKQQCEITLKTNI